MELGEYRANAPRHTWQTLPRSEAEGQKVPVQTLQRRHAEGGQGRPLLRVPAGSQPQEWERCSGMQDRAREGAAPHDCPGGRGRTGKQGTWDLVMQINLQLQIKPL